MTTIIGIDLGTTNSGVAIWEDGEPRVIKDAKGNSLTPSVVALDPEDKGWVVGRQAQTIAVSHPRVAIYSIKRFIGRRFSDDVIQEELRHGRILYELEESRRRRDAIEVALGERHLTPQEVSAKILQKLKSDAEVYLGHRIDQAVVTVPAYFHDSQRQATRDAGRIAGLTVRRIVNEPTAACLAFGYKKLMEPRRMVAVYDLGGGTFDISLLEVGRGPFTVRATNGDMHLGGDDLDWIIIDWVMSKLGEQTKQKTVEDVVALAKLRAAAEQAKITLSSEASARIQIPGPLSPVSEVCDLDMELTQVELDIIAESFIAQTLAPCARALRDAQLKRSDIDEIVLVGGQTRMPAIRRAVEEFFGKEPDVSLHPEEVVALGAAVQSAILGGKATGLRLADVVPLSLGVETRGRMDVIIPRNTPVPVRVPKSYSTAYDNQESVEVKVYQGEHPMVADNIKLASFMLRGIEPAPAGEPEIRVTFRVDQDSILHVVAEDVNTANRKEITITDSIRLSEREITMMVREAEADIRASEEKVQKAEVLEFVDDQTNGESTELSQRSMERQQEVDERVKITVVNQDIANYPCDLIILKYAQSFYGADQTVSHILMEHGIALEAMCPPPKQFRLISTDGMIAAHHVLFVGVERLSEFGCVQIQEFAEQALRFAAVEVPSAVHLAMTIHGVGYGLDEYDAFIAQLNGLQAALQQSAAVEKITIVEQIQERALRLRQILDKYQR